MGSSEDEPVTTRRRSRTIRPRQNQSARARILLILVIGVAILLILLRLAEFAGHRVRHARAGTNGVPQVPVLGSGNLPRRLSNIPRSEA